MVTVVLPIKTKNPLNGNREHWAKKHRRVNMERGTTVMLLRAALRANPVSLPAVAKLTRIAFRELDSDNLGASLKSIRDGVADAMQTDDSNSSLLQFEYAQEKCKRGKFAVRVDIA